MFKASKEALGEINHVWTDSYNGQKAFFVNHNILVYTCGSLLKFHNVESKETSNFTPINFNAAKSDIDQSSGICLLTANSALNLLAFSETILAPKVHIFEYSVGPQKISTLSDGASIEYLAVEFSNSEAILTLSGIPELEIIIWNWKTGQRITSFSLNPSLMYPEHVCFSPTNWRNISVAYKNEIHLWNLEICDPQRVKTNKTRLRMPLSNKGNESASKESALSRLKDEFEYSSNVISGLSDETNGAILDEILDNSPRHFYKSHCWSNVDEILISTNENYIFKYSTLDNSLEAVVVPKINSEPNISHEALENDRRLNFYADTNINSIYMHRKALIVQSEDGKLRLIDGANFLSINNKKEGAIKEKILVKKCIDTSSEFISNISFNTKFNMLAISTLKGIFLVNMVNYASPVNLSVDLSINFDFGNTVGVSCLCPFSEFFLVLKENGCLQMWNYKEKSLINRIFLKENVSCISAHPSLLLAVVGTTNGSLIFIDFSNSKSPRIIMHANIHKDKKCKKLKFNSSGSLLFSVGDDNKVFVIETSLSGNAEKLITSVTQCVQYFSDGEKFQPNFYVLGYLEFDGKAICIDTFDYQSEDTTSNKSIITRAVIGLHDASSWENTKKNSSESPLSVSPSLSNNMSQSNQSILNQNVQTQSSLPRLNYVTASIDPDYYCKNSKEQVLLCSKLLVFEINLNMIKSNHDATPNKETVYETLKLDFKDDAINKFTVYSHYLFSECCLTGRNYLLTFSDRFLTKFTIPENETKKNPNKSTYLDLNEIVGSHDFGYGCISRTTNNQFVVTGGYDGSFSIRKATDLKTFITQQGPNYANGGIKMAVFHNDVKNLILLGYDNTIANYNWVCKNEANFHLIKLPFLEVECNGKNLENLSVKQQKPISNLTWLENREQKSFWLKQDQQFLPIQKEIVKSLSDIKIKLKELIKTNQNREDIAKLKEHEFYLDLEELERLQKESDSEILKIKDETEFENLGKLFIRELIKKECWDKMKIKGRGIQAFNTNLLVENYPIKERSKEETQFLEKVKLLRKIEIATKKTSADLSLEIMKNDNVKEMVEFKEEDSEKDPDYTSKNQITNTYLSPNLAILSFKGSIGSLFNGDSPLFYNQFEMFTREQKLMQIALVQDAIFKIKENFNKEFEQIIQRKNQEIAKIKEKNLRLKQIYIDLNEDKQIDEPQFGDAENPEVLFEVKDDEIKVEKYLTAEQRKQLEAQLAEDAKRKELEKMDNWRDRGLLDMMGGVLQIRREDELKKDIPVPSFVNERPQEEWTAEEVKLYQIYEQKVKELNDERDKLRKQLIAEIGKINEQIVECYQSFDGQLLSLHQRKVKTQQAIYQEELKIVRLFNLMVVDAELETAENQLSSKLEKAKEQRKEIAQEIQLIKKVIEGYREEFDILSAEDKSQEKAFVREFADVPSASRDQLLKLYRKRAKQRAPVNKISLNPAPVFIPEMGEDNPFSERPSTCQQINIYDRDTEQTLRELDHFDNAPGGVDKSVWDRFTMARRQKIEAENILRNKGLNLNEMNLFFQRRNEEEEAKRSEIDDLSRSLFSLTDLRMKASHNLQIQLLMKQGQVEIEPTGYVRRFDNTVLIHRGVVESINKVIETHGKQKIAIMVDCKDFRKGIRQLEWEHKKMKMTIEDYITKQRDITYLKLTREVQEYLGTIDYDGKKLKEAAILEQTIAYQNKAHERTYGLKAKNLKEIKKHSVKTGNENDKLDDQLNESNIILHQRKHVNEEMTGKGIEVIREEKFQQIIQRRKLVDLAKAQAQEVAFLRSEVERLRMKTFPALVQIEF